MRRGEIWLVRFDPTVGSEIRKTRPAVVVSPDAANDRLGGVIVAPLTSRRRNWPTRVGTVFENTVGEAALDQIRAVDKQRLIRQLGSVSDSELRRICQTLQGMFAY